MPQSGVIHIPSSFRDPSGFLYYQDGQLLRQVNKNYQDDFDLLISSGLYDRLIEAKLLVPFTEINVVPAQQEIAYKVIRPKKLDFISYPYEWSFSQLKDAALLTLAVEKIAIKHGMTLKDASAYNIQFDHGAPVLIDSLSFTRYIEGKPWVAYRQFCQHFLAPLALMSLKDIRLNKLLLAYIDGMPLDLASKLLPGKTRLNFGLASHIHIHAYAQRHVSDKTRTTASKTRSVNKLSLIGLLDSLETTIKNLKWKPIGTEWAGYYDATNYSEDAFDIKRQIVSQLIHELCPKIIWDLGANTGVFSRLANDLKDSLVIATDIDPGAVEINYLECKRAGVTNVLPLVIDLTNPPPAIGWWNKERDAFVKRGPANLLLALALIHHLAISNNVPLADVSRFLASIGEHLIIEFVPKEDSQVQRLLASRDDIFDEYNEEGFLRAFSSDFNLVKRLPISGTVRTIFLFKRKENYS